MPASVNPPDAANSGRDSLLGSGRNSLGGSSSTPVVLATAMCPLSMAESAAMQRDALIRSRSKVLAASSMRHTLPSHLDSAALDNLIRSQRATTPHSPERPQVLVTAPMYSNPVEVAAVYPNPLESGRMQNDALMRSSRGSLSPHSSDRFHNLGFIQHSGGSAKALTHRPPPRTGSTSPPIVRMLTPNGVASAGSHTVLWPGARSTRVNSPRSCAQQPPRLDRSGSPGSRNGATSRERLRPTSLTAPPAPPAQQPQKSAARQTRSYTPNSMIANQPGQTTPQRRIKVPS